MQKDTSVIGKFNVKESGSGEKTLLLAHGFGCNQNMWRFIAPALAKNHRVILFDYVGFGHADAAYFSVEKYASLKGYADDVVELCESLSLQEVTLVTHSVSGMIGLLAMRKHPALFANIVMVCPSPCFLNLPPDYFGGFEEQDLQDLIGLMDKNYIGWANYLAPLVLGLNQQEHIKELTDSFCSTDPLSAKAFAQATFFSDYRHILPECRHPALILQSKIDVLADVSIGRYMQSCMPDCKLTVINAEGHCLHMTHPALVLSEIDTFLQAA